MSKHRRAIIAILSAALLVAALVGPAGAHLRKASGKRVSKKHARMHRAEAALAAQPSSVDLAPSGLVASSGHLRMYSTTVDGQVLQELVNEGYDVTPVEETVEGTEIVLVLSAGERKALQAKGVSVRFESSGREQKAGRQAVTAADSIYGWDVFRSYDEPGGIEDQIRAIANRPQNRGFLRLFDIGDSIEGRDILAVRMTQGARGLPLGKRPAVLYQGTTHAREWISTEVAMRLLEWYVAERRAGNPEIQELLETTELWFVPVVNPDGYEYTFTDERLWRKNLRDNDGDGTITNSDGVDLNRNYPEHWNYDEEGSSSQFSSETYRGAAPGSEPEAAADIDLIENMGDFKFAISYHSFGQLLLYTQGWQTLTPSADDPIYVALTGTDDDPAVEDFNPGVGADLYTTNGEFTDWAHGEAGVLAWTPELSDHGQEFEFPDDEALVQEEFEKNLEFALNVARSAGDPDDPASHMGLDTAGLYVNVAEIDPWKSNWPNSDLRVQTSYAGGSSQPVEVLAKRAISDVTLHYSINGGTEQTGPTAESPDGEVYGGNNAYSTYYHYLRGEIPGLAVGDSVDYWFSGGGESTDPVSFEVVEDADADVLIVAAEDYTGVTNLPAYASTTSPNFLSYYEDAVAASGRTFDVYDVDANDRTSPDHLGVLGHYDTVLWYEGNDLVTRSPDRGPGNVSRLAVDNTLNMRQYLNEGGALNYSGQWAGGVVNGVGGNQFYDPVADEPCVVGGVPSPVFARCLLWADKNDFLQYYLGGFAYNSDGGTDPAGDPFPLEATDTPYTGGGPWTFNGADSAQNQVHTASFLTTSSILPKDEYPQFVSDARANWDRGGTGGSPFEPFEGDWYVYSDQASVTYKRLMRSFSVPGAGGDMTFRFSYDTEVDWDFVFVEIHDLAADTWATAPDQNGHTTSDTGQSCPSGWFELHPWLEQYQGSDCSGGGWNANSGRSAGWEEWSIDLDPYAGKDIEISISYASDWAVQGLGAFVDQVALPGEAVESFEGGLGVWTVPGPPPGSDSNPNDWFRTQSLGFEEGAIVSQTPTTANFATLYFGFGLEGVDGAAARADLMGRTLFFLGA